MQNHHCDSRTWNDFDWRDEDIIVATYGKAGECREKDGMNGGMKSMLTRPCGITSQQGGANNLKRLLSMMIHAPTPALMCDGVLCRNHADAAVAGRYAPMLMLRGSAGCRLQRA